jgi:hypothetical protein
MPVYHNHEETGRWKTVPMEIFENLALSPVSKFVLGWILTRPKNWELVIGPLIRATGISQHVWLKTVRPELIESGYLICDKSIENGRVVWHHTVVSRPSEPF